LTLEPFDIRIVSSAGNDGIGFLLQQISGAERFRFGTAFQLALAEATGVRFALIDRADVLDQQKRNLLTTLLLNSGIDQGVVLASGEDPPPIAIATGVKFFGQDWRISKAG
jgi:hypothetical protein